MLNPLELLCVHFPGFVAMSVTAGAVWLAVSMGGVSSLTGAPADSFQRSPATHAALAAKRDPGASCESLAAALMFVRMGGASC